MDNSCIIPYLVLWIVFLMGTNGDPEIVSRTEWGAQPPKAQKSMRNPVPYVVIHHSEVPAACYTKEDCIKKMQSMQNYHQTNKNWYDIGYSFAVGSDNRVYEGRGWSVVGTHAPMYNSRSIGICVIGNWSDALPPAEQLNTIKKLIEMGIREGKIMADYKLIGHRQVRQTDCPGTALYNEIKTWPHWTGDPR